MEAIWIIYDISIFIDGFPFARLKTSAEPPVIHHVLTQETKRELPSVAKSLTQEEIDNLKKRVLAIIKSSGYSENPLQEFGDGLGKGAEARPLSGLSHCVNLAVELDKAHHGDLVIVAAKSERINYEIAKNKLNHRNIYYASSSAELEA